MARPQKNGLDYFALDVSMDDEVELIEAQHGLVGFAVLIKMFQKIYSHGYFYEWDEKQQILFANKVSVDRNTVTSIVSDCIRWGIFNTEIYDKYKVLTSKRIQSHYLSAVYKRVKVQMIKEFLLVEQSDVRNTEYISINDNENVICNSVSDIGNEDISNVSDIQSTQSKSKSKVKENIKDIYTIFEQWNLAKIIVHKSLNSKMENHINARLKDYDLEQIIRAIKNFKIVLESDFYYWSHRWTLQDFMKPNNIVRFIEESKPLETFRKEKKNERNKPNNRADHREEFDYDELSL